MTQCPAAYERFATKRDLQRALLERFTHETLGAVATAFSAAPGTEAPCAPVSTPCWASWRRAPSAVGIIARLLSGGLQSLATWWVDHPDVPRGELVDRVLQVAWLGLERLSRGAG